MYKMEQISTLFPKVHGVFLLHYFIMIHHSLTQQKSIPENHSGFIFQLQLNKP